MYLDMVRIGEKVMESCWLLICLQKKKKKKKKRDTKVSYIVKREEMKSWKEEWKTKEVHNEVSSSQD